MATTSTHPTGWGVPTANTVAERVSAISTTAKTPRRTVIRDRCILVRRLTLLVAVLAACSALALTVGEPPVWCLFLLPLIAAASLLEVAGALLVAAIATCVELLHLQLMGVLSGAGWRSTLLAGVIFAAGGCVLGRLRHRQRVQERRLAENGIIDRLTGLHNYGAFADILERQVSIVDRYGGQATLVMIDLDRFKRFNDTFGHEAGNLALEQFGETLRRLVRGADVAARYGGEEFAVLISGAELDGMRLAERIRREVLTQPVRVRGEQVYISVSAGVATYPDCAASATELVERADAALYESKEAGRNAVTGYTIGASGPSRSRLRAVANG
jgi:diguanylate cyclase (GGDEF)-like protein